MHVSRSLSDQFFCVVVPWSSSISNTSPPSFMRMFAPSWRIIVIGVSGGMNCCLPSADMGSSSTKNRITPFTPTIPAGKSRTCTTLAVPIPPQVAIMLDGVTSAGTKPSHRLLCSSVRQATSWSHDQTNELKDASDQSCIPQQSWMHHRTTCKTTNYATVLKHHLAKRNSWLKIEGYPSVLDSDALPLAICPS